MKDYNWAIYVGQISNGEKNGHGIHYCSYEGIKSEEGHYKNDKKDGYIKKYFYEMDYASLECTSYCQGDQLIGPFSYYHDNGKLLYRCAYKKKENSHKAFF